MSLGLLGLISLVHCSPIGLADAFIGSGDRLHSGASTFVIIRSFVIIESIREF
jgi:hypothetical protein